MTTTIDEARLIEIEQRFVRLEYAIQRLDKIAASVEDRHRKSMERLRERACEAGAKGNDSAYSDLCKDAYHHELEMDHVVEVRAVAEQHAELCRDDLEMMVGTIRGGR